MLTFNDLLEAIDDLPVEQQEDLIRIVRHRLTDRRREEIAERVRLARIEFAEGRTKRGSVEDLMNDLDG